MIGILGGLFLDSHMLEKCMFHLDLYAYLKRPLKVHTLLSEERCSTIEPSHFFSNFEFSLEIPDQVCQVKNAQLFESVIQLILKMYLMKNSFKQKNQI